jgi:hypothetical protein
VQQDGRLGLQASHPARRVCEEGRVNELSGTGLGGGLVGERG